MKDFKFIAGIGTGMLLLYSLKLVDSLVFEARRYVYRNSYQRNYGGVYNGGYYSPYVRNSEFNRLWDKVENLKYRVDDLEEIINEEKEDK